MSVLLVLHSLPNFLELGCSKGKKMKDSDFTRHPLPLLFEIIHGFAESASEVFFTGLVAALVAGLCSSSEHTFCWNAN